VLARQQIGTAELCALRSDDTEAIWSEAPDTAWPGLDSGLLYTFVTLDP
jgi:hypothetical protein